MPVGKYVAGVGPLSQVKIMIVGEAPGAVEEEYGKPFVGPTGDLLDELLGEAGIQRDECYITNVVKYRPPANDFKRLHEIGVDLQSSINELKEEIKRVNPNIILALGEQALRGTTGKFGISNYRGSILRAFDGQHKVVSTFHPANLLYQRARSKGKGLFKYAWKYVMIADLKRVKEQSLFPELKLPQRNITIARSSLDLYRFLERHDRDAKPTVDIESINCLPVCVGIAYNKYEAISVPLYRRIFGVNVSDASLIDIADRWTSLAKVLGKGNIIGQNFKYDEEKLYRLGLHCGSLYADTLMLEHTLNPELPSKKLHVISSIRTEEPYYKEEGSEFRFGKDNIDNLFLYNGRDCCVTREVWEDQDKELNELRELYSPQIVDFYYNYVVKLHKFYLQMERNGFAVDKHIRKRLRQKYTAWHNRIQREFIKDVGHAVNVASPKQLFELLYKELNCPLRKDTGEDTIVGLIGNNIKDDRRKKILSNIIDDRRVRKALSTNVNVKLDYDGRVKTTWFITGTETGRSSTNLLKPPVRPERIGWSGHAMPKHGDIGPDTRRMLVLDEGYVFLSVDLSQAEARIVAVLSEDYELLKAFDTIDIHRRTAGLVFGYTPTLELGKECSSQDVIKMEKDSGERFVGKKTRHAGNYNMGKDRFHKEVQTDARRFGIKIDFSEYRAGKALDLFHGASPRIRGIFHRDIRMAIDSKRVLVNPFGRFRIFLDRGGEDLYKEAFAFIPQSSVHDRLTMSGIKIKDRAPDLRFILETHDSFTVLARKGEVEETAKMMKEELEKEIDFSQCSIKRNIKLVIPTDFEVGERNLACMTKLKI
jgi:uracil-DNA glycosylase family 4